MLRVSLAPVIRTTQTVVTTTDTGHEYEDVMIKSDEIGSMDGQIPHFGHVEQCFSNAGPRSGTGPWHQLYRAARGLKKLQYATRFN
jgi:hypothetical protein